MSGHCGETLLAALEALKFLQRIYYYRASFTAASHHQLTF